MERCGPVWLVGRPHPLGEVPSDVVPVGANAPSRGDRSESLATPSQVDEAPDLGAAFTRKARWLFLIELRACS
jgi:hypothetical protein